MAQLHQKFRYKYIAAAAADQIVKSAPGYLKAIIVGDAVGSSVIEVSDHVSDGDGNVKIYLAGDNLGPDVYPIDTYFESGITLDIANQTHVTVVYF